MQASNGRKFVVPWPSLDATEAVYAGASLKDIGWQLRYRCARMRHHFSSGN